MLAVHGSLFGCGGGVGGMSFGGGGAYKSLKIEYKKKLVSE
jgi:hypothetical protein